MTYSLSKTTVFTLFCLLIGLMSSCDLIKKEQNPIHVYNQEMAVFKKNESETLPFYGTLKTVPRNTLILQLESIVIPKWKQNEEIVNKLANLKGLPGDLIAKNQKYQQYTNMRLQSMDLLRKAMMENSSAYSSQIENLEQDINTLVESL